MVSSFSSASPKLLDPNKANAIRISTTAAEEASTDTRIHSIQWRGILRKWALSRSYGVSCIWRRSATWRPRPSIRPCPLLWLFLQTGPGVTTCRGWIISSMPQKPARLPTVLEHDEVDALLAQAGCSRADDPVWRMAGSRWNACAWRVKDV